MTNAAYPNIRGISDEAKDDFMKTWFLAFVRNLRKSDRIILNAPPVHHRIELTDEEREFFRDR